MAQKRRAAPQAGRQAAGVLRSILRMKRIGLAPLRVPTAARRVPPAPKVAAPTYRDSEYPRWRARVIARAGARCEWREAGQRCGRSHPDHRMYADHIVEVRDGGAEFDPANGQCLCASHHQLKTAAERRRRLDG